MESFTFMVRIDLDREKRKKERKINVFLSFVANSRFVKVRIAST